MTLGLPPSEPVAIRVSAPSQHREIVLVANFRF